MDSTLIAQLLGQMDKSTQESPYSMKGLAYKALNQMDDFNKESPDYGMDSYIKKNGVPAPYRSMVEYMKGGRHIGDEFKMPNHQTFSTQSSYSAPDMQGGEWKTGGAEGSPYWSFKPSEFNLKQNPIEELMKYWKSNQPEGTFLQLPDGSYYGGVR